MDVETELQLYHKIITQIWFTDWIMKILKLQKKQHDII